MDLLLHIFMLSLALQCNADPQSEACDVLVCEDPDGDSLALALVCDGTDPGYDYDYFELRSE